MKCKKCGYDHEGGESAEHEKSEEKTGGDGAASKKPTDLEPVLDSAQADPKEAKRKNVIKMGLAKSLSKKIGQ